MPPRKKSGLNEPPKHPPSSPVTNPDGSPAPPREHPTPHLPSVSTESSPSSGSVFSSQVNSENWANLNGLMDTLRHTAGITGLGAVKSVIEGLVELIGLYEDAAQGQKEFDDLRLQLECIFDELNHHLASSPAVTTSIDSICWSVRKEINAVKTEQAKGKRRKPQGTEADTYIVLECYLRIQSHLQRLTLNTNTSAWMIFDQLATDNLLRTLAPSLWPCYNSEKAIELERRQCTEGTRVNVLAQTQKWAIALDTGNIYWMSGMAGTGKTTIAYSLCEWLDAKECRKLGASFFCSRSLPECRDCALFQAMEKEPDAHTRMPQLQFDSLLVQPLSNIKVQEAFPANVVVVIDALDECNDIKSTKLILDVLLTRSRNLPIKFVVSSRPEPAIRDKMEKNGTWVDARVVLHEIDTGEVQADIKTYLKAELSPIAPTDPEIEQLVARAGVLFIYAATVIRYIGYDDFGRNPRARLKAVLKKTGKHAKAQTKDLDGLYRIVLDAAFEDPSLGEDEQGDMKLILDTVICAREPLTVSALNGLLQLDDVDRVHAALRPLWSVLHVIGPNMFVTTLHASFPDYLLDPERSGAWHCDAAAHHHLLTLRCFESIRDAKPQFNICRLESSYLIDDEVPDLDTRVQEFISTELRYACQYWAIHLDTVEPSAVSSIAPVLLRFLTTHLLLWMEVRNLTKTMAMTLGELRTAQQWATRHGMACDRIDLLNDAWRFAYRFASGSVSQSTPHLYTSMLPLLSHNSPIRKHFLCRFRGMIGAEGTALDRRKDTPLALWQFDLDVECMACSPDGSLAAVGGSCRSNGGVTRQRLYLLDTSSGNILFDCSDPDESNIYCIAFSPDSTRLVSGDPSGYITELDIPKGSFVKSFEVHESNVTAILFSHDAAHIVSASEDNIIRISDATSGKLALSPLIGHTDKVLCMAITSDCMRIISGSRDRTIRVWDMQVGKIMLVPLVGHEGEVTAIALSSNDSHIVSGSDDGTIRVWGSKTGYMMHILLWNQYSGVTSLSISPDNTSISFTTRNFDGVRIVDAACGKVVSQLGPFSENVSHTTHAVYLPDCTRIVSSRKDGVVRVLDTQSITPEIPLPGHTKAINSVDISPDCRHAVSGSDDCTVCFWDLAEGTLRLGPLQGHAGPVRMVRFSPDGSRIISYAEDSTLRQWDAQSGELQGTSIRVESNGYFHVLSATYSPGGTGIASLSGDGALYVWNSSNGQSILGPIHPPGRNQGQHVAYSTDGAVVIASYSSWSIVVWDAQSGEMLHNETCGPNARLLRVLFFRGFEADPKSPYGSYYAWSSPDGQIGVRRTATGQQISEPFQCHADLVRSVRFSPDGTRLLAWSEDRAVYVWDVEAEAILFRQKNGLTSETRSVATSPDGENVILSSNDLSLCVWSVQPEKPSPKYQGIDYADWVLNTEGWAVCGESRRLFWVPGDLIPRLILPRNRALISPKGTWRLDFEGALIGEAWAGCWRNN